MLPGPIAMLPNAEKFDHINVAVISRITRPVSTSGALIGSWW